MIGVLVYPFGYKNMNMVVTGKTLVFAFEDISNIELAHDTFSKYLGLYVA